MGLAYICRRTPYTQEFEEQLGIYPIGINGLPQGNVIVLDCVTSLSKYLFMDNPQVTNVNLPNTILTLSSQAFKNCSKLVRLDIPDEVRTIPSECFYGCSSLTQVTLPKNLISIGDNAFRDCTSLRTIEVEEGTIVKNGAFHEVTEIQRRKGDPTIKEAKLKKHAILKKQAFEKRAARNRFKQKEKSRKRWGILFCLLILSLVVCWYIFYVMH